MEARLTKQLLHIVELDKRGDLSPEIQHRLSDALDIFHREEQHRTPGGPTGPSLRAPHANFPKLSAAPKISMPKPPPVPGVK